MFYFKGQRRPLELAPTQAEAFVMRVTHRSLFQPLCLSPSPPPPPTPMCTPSGGGGGRGGLAAVVKGLMGGAVHTGAVVLSVWHIKLYKGNHLCATPYY